MAKTEFSPRNTKQKKMTKNESLQKIAKAKTEPRLIRRIEVANKEHLMKRMQKSGYLRILTR